MFTVEAEGEHNVGNFVLCSSAHHACSPVLQGFLHEAELCKVPLARGFFLGCDLPLSGLNAEVCVSS